MPKRFILARVEVSAHDGEIVIHYEGKELDRHAVVAPGAVSIKDQHYGGATIRPSRAVRARSDSEPAFFGAGPGGRAVGRQGRTLSTQLVGSLRKLVGSSRGARHTGRLGTGWLRRGVP